LKLNGQRIQWSREYSTRKRSRERSVGFSPEKQDCPTMVGWPHTRVPRGDVKLSFKLLHFL